jgi:hypothetical protein
MLYSSDAFDGFIDAKLSYDTLLKAFTKEAKS